MLTTTLGPPPRDTNETFCNENNYVAIFCDVFIKGLDYKVIIFGHPPPSLCIVITFIIPVFERHIHRIQSKTNFKLPPLVSNYPLDFIEVTFNNNNKLYSIFASHGISICLDTLICIGITLTSLRQLTKNYMVTIGSNSQ